MCVKKKTMGTVRVYKEQIARLRREMQTADAIVIGAGAGLSTSAGFSYSGERFEKYFSDFEAAYGFKDMYTGGFYPYKTPEEFWAYWSRAICVNRYMDAPGDVYETLFSLVDGMDYFVITTNVDHCFQKAGFDKKRLFYTQGDYGLFQCSTPCHAKTYDNESVIRRMLERQSDMKIPTDLIPVCPVCGAPMTTNLRCDDTFVEDEGWHQAAERYSRFLETRKNCRTLFLELGVGYNTPVIIKYPFYQMVAHNPHTLYVCVNHEDAFCPPEIKKRAMCLKADIGEVVRQLSVYDM